MDAQTPGRCPVNIILALSHLPDWGYYRFRAFLKLTIMVTKYLHTQIQMLS